MAKHGGQMHVFRSLHSQNPTKMEKLFFLRQKPKEDGKGENTGKVWKLKSKLRSDKHLNTLEKSESQVSTGKAQKQLDLHTKYLFTLAPVPCTETRELDTKDL